MNTKAHMDDNPFQLISQSDILTADDWLSLLPMKEELKDTFKKSQVFRTRTEMEVSVLNDLKHPTSASKYWQAVREQNVMFTELVELSYEYRKKLIETEKLSKKYSEEQDDLEKKLIQIDMERNQFHLRQMEKVAKDRIREIRAWSEIKEREAAKMSEYELANVDNHQLVSYTKRWLKQALAAGDSGSPAERQNLYGQLLSGYSRCMKEGLIEDVLDGFNSNDKKRIKQNVTALIEEAQHG